MITARRMQSDFADLWIRETVDDLWEPWMRHAHKALADAELLDLIQAELNKRCSKSKTRGRPAYPVEVILAMLLLKHLRNMSFVSASREVRGNLVYRQFTGIGGGAVPDEKTLGRVSRQLGPEAVGKIQARMVELARQQNVVQGAKARMDTTVVETDVHYPTDSKLINDGVRVLTREMKRLGGVIGRKVRDHSRSVKLRVLEIARASRNRTGKGKQQMKAAYGKLLETAGRVVGQAKRVARESALAIPLAARKPVRHLNRLNQMIPLVEQVMRQTRARVMGGNTRAEGKIASVFEPHTAVIRKGKASKPTSSETWCCWWRPRTRSSPATGSARAIRPIRRCWAKRWRNTSPHWGVRRICWRPTRAPSRRPMRSARSRWEWARSRSRSKQPRARNG